MPDHDSTPVTAVVVAPSDSVSPIGVEHSSRSCDGALVRAFSFLGKRWNGVILASLFDGAIGFAELRRAVGAISDSVLSDRLSELCTAGLVERRVFVGPPVSVEYKLTPAGEALLPAMQALTTWSRTNLPA
jgi:DNA-binding HxlR family transcriptional regulator